MYKQLFDKEAHQLSLQTLELLNQHPDFMESVATVLDIGCGPGHDLHWWATRTVEDNQGKEIPLNIKCTGVDHKNRFDKDLKHRNIIEIVEADMENTGLKPNSFDVINAPNILQLAVNPLQTLGHWYDLCRDNGMLIVSVPETTTVERTKIVSDQYSNEYYHWTLVSLMHMLAVNGWDCSGGFFKKDRNDPWIHAIVYKQPNFKKLDYKSATWFDLVEQNLIPESAVKSLNQRNYVSQQDLVLMWLDKSIRDFRTY